MEINAHLSMEQKKAKLAIEEVDHILVSYPANDPEHPDWFIYEYESHRKVLVRVDSKSGKVEFLREL